VSRLLALALAALPAAAADPPPELALVPADAAGVVHVRVADVWKNPALAEYREIIRRAGDKALAALDEQFVPAPSTIDRVTAFALPLAPGADPRVVVVARFSRPFDPKAVRAAYMPDAKPQAAGGKEFFADPRAKVAAHFPDDRTLVLSDDAGLAEYLAHKPAAGGRLTAALAEAADKPLAVVVNLRAVPLPPDALKQVPPDFKPILDAELATLSVSLDPAPKLAARLVYASPDEATAADVALRKGLKQLKPFLDQGRAKLEEELYGKRPPAGTPRPLGDLPTAAGAVLGLGAIGYAEELLASPPVKKVGPALVAELDLPAGSSGTVGMTSVMVGLLLPAVQKVREAAARSQSQNNLKQMGLALHNYHDANGAFPPAAFTSRKGGRGGLSWRVAVLPYIDQDALYKQFKLDEPWDSEHNRKLIPSMPKVYADPRNTPAEPGLTYYKAFVGRDVPDRAGKPQPGPDAIWSWSAGRRITGITDGTSNTFLVAAFGPPVPWTKPADFEHDPKAPLPDLFAPFAGLNVVLGDGSVRFVAPTVDPKVLRAMITAQGGEVIGLP
jgi:hypothetical protein